MRKEKLGALVEIVAGLDQTFWVMATPQDRSIEDDPDFSVEIDVACKDLAEIKRVLVVAESNDLGTTPIERGIRLVGA